VDENGEKILEEDKAREQQALQEQKMTLFGYFGRLAGGGMPPTRAEQEDQGAQK